MKNTFTLFILLICSTVLHAQITINSADMPSSGDIIRFSTAANNTTVNLLQTGAGQTWDFSYLQPIGQSLDTFVSVTSTPITYLLTFGFTSNLAARGIQLSSIGFLPVNNGYSFYNKNASGFRQKGFGAELNGIPVPVPYNNDDDIYLFPLNFGDQDTSDSDYNVTIPGQGSAIGNQRRINHVDGWGTVITPYGSFSALRILSVLTGEDSLYLDTLGFGFNLQRALTKEYKWLANGQDIPVLQINTTTNNFGVESVSLIRFRDSLRAFASVPENLPFIAEPRLYPNPTAGSDVMAVMDLKTPTEVTLDILDPSGRLISRRELFLSSGIQQVQVKSSDLQLNAGLYFVCFRVGNESRTARLIVSGR